MHGDCGSWRFGFLALSQTLAAGTFLWSFCRPREAQQAVPVVHETEAPTPAEAWEARLGEERATWRREREELRRSRDAWRSAALLLGGLLAAAVGPRPPCCCRRLRWLGSSSCELEASFASEGSTFTAGEVLERPPLPATASKSRLVGHGIWGA